jgi:hypothetical protein
LGAAPAQEGLLVDGALVGAKVVTYVEKMKLISRAANAVRKQKYIPLQP